MFRGRFFHTIDPKGRVSIPAKFRDALESDYSEKRLVIVPNEYCLEVHPMKEWKEIEAKVRALPQKDPDVQKFIRLYISHAQDAALGGAGGRDSSPGPAGRGGVSLAPPHPGVGGGRHGGYGRTR